MKEAYPLEPAGIMSKEISMAKFWFAMWIVVTGLFVAQIITSIGLARAMRKRIKQEETKFEIRETQGEVFKFSSEKGTWIYVEGLEGYETNDLVNVKVEHVRSQSEE